MADTALARFCPSCNLAREAATLSLVTRIALSDALIPLGKLHSFGPLLAHAGFVYLITFTR